jgi:hypothetical protein
VHAGLLDQTHAQNVMQNSVSGAIEGHGINLGHRIQLQNIYPVVGIHINCVKKK